MIFLIVLFYDNIVGVVKDEFLQTYATNRLLCHNVEECQLKFNVNGMSIGPVGDL